MMQDQDTVCLKEPEDPQSCPQNTIAGLNAKLARKFKSNLTCIIKLHVYLRPGIASGILLQDLATKNLICISRLHRA